MSTRKHKLKKTEIAKTFSEGGGVQVPPILTAVQFADLLRVSVKTIYQWVAQGRLDGAFRKRGKHLLIWRDRAIEIIFNGRDWS